LEEIEMGEHKIPKKKKNNLWKLVNIFNTQFKNPLLKNVDVSAEITDEGFCIQINERTVELDKNFDMVGTCTEIG
jgi:hypothetical protein